MKHFMYLLFIILLGIYSCGKPGLFQTGEIPTQVNFNYKTEAGEEINEERESEFVTIEKNGISISGYPTHNKKIVEEIITPAVTPKLDELKTLPPHKIVNALALLTFNVFQEYIGESFYRWGGDIFDLDDPQNESIRFKKSYGLDCSGFTTAGYELAVYYNLLTPEQALYSSAGFEKYAGENNIKDSGGIKDTPNRFRVDTKELAILGEEILKIDKNGSISQVDIEKLQAGDILGKSGHFGIIVEIAGNLYYVESGGWVLSENDQKPVPVKEAVQLFAAHGPIYVRRCLPAAE